jgi:hypothetical protein
LIIDSHTNLYFAFLICFYHPMNEIIEHCGEFYLLDWLLEQLFAKNHKVCFTVLCFCFLLPFLWLSSTHVHLPLLTAIRFWSLVSGLNVQYNPLTFYCKKDLPSREEELLKITFFILSFRMNICFIWYWITWLL